jgi:hypothetical protein
VPIEGDLGVEAVLRALAVVVVAVVVVGALVGVVVSRARDRRVGVVSPVLGVVAVSCAVVVAIVVTRQLQAIATGWDRIWALAAGALGVLATRRLIRRPQP